MRAERRRVLAWLLAGALVTAGAAAVADQGLAVTMAFVSVWFVLWSVRQVAGLTVARRDFNRASSPPRRAFVVLMHDPNPRAVRPLLAIWSERPPPGERLPKPESVWRCDDELDQLESRPHEIEVHEAWVDTGPRSWSKPRWVRADAGIAVTHRRSMFGRWYVNTSLRRDRPDAARELTLTDPHAAPAGIGGEQELEVGGSLLASTAGRVALLAVLAGVIVAFGMRRLSVRSGAGRR